MYGGKDERRETVFNRRSEYVKQWASLEAERATWVQTWQDIADYVSPRSFRYLVNDRNRGTRRTSRIINSVATMAVETEAAGMMAGITSPARPWFRLGLHNEELAEWGPVREWLDTAEDILRRVLAGSNAYRGLHKAYEALIQFGTTVLHVDEDTVDTLRVYDFPPGQYALANSERLQVDTCYRKFSMTVAQLVRRFGYDACSAQVKTLWDNGSKQAWVDVLHVMEPNVSYEPGVLGVKGKPYRSCFMEWGAVHGTETQPNGYVDGFLEERGYSELPFMAPRWNTTGEDVYGEGPTMRAMGDIRGLQELERIKGKLVAKLSDPPMVGPSSMMNQRSSILPGAMNYVDAVGAGQAFRPAVEVNPAGIGAVETSIREHETRIKEMHLVDMWMMLNNGEDERQPMTAREVAERHEEKITRLGPVMESIERDLLGPFIQRSLAIAARKKLLPPPPRELLGQEYTIEYLSIISQALKMIGNTGIDGVTGFALRLVEAGKADVLDVLDTDKMVREYATNLGVKSSLLVDEDAVKTQRQQRAQAAAQQAQLEQAATMAKGARDLSASDMSGDNALTRLLPEAAQPGGLQ